LAEQRTPLWSAGRVRETAGSTENLRARVLVGNVTYFLDGWRTSQTPDLGIAIPVLGVKLKRE